MVTVISDNYSVDRIPTRSVQCLRLADYQCHHRTSPCRLFPCSLLLAHFPDINLLNLSLTKTCGCRWLENYDHEGQMHLPSSGKRGSHPWRIPLVGTHHATLALRNETRDSWKTASCLLFWSGLDPYLTRFAYCPESATCLSQTLLHLLYCIAKDQQTDLFHHRFHLHLRVWPTQVTQKPSK